MRLSKWYGDCVTSDGRAFIAYWARLRVGPLRIPYAAALEAGIRRTAEQRVTSWPGPAPTATPATTRWSCPRLDFHATWVPDTAPAASHTLFASPAGTIVWRCVAPRAKVRVARSGNGALRGRGYLEHLVTTVPLHRLPMRELRWGRFVSAAHALSWIAWRGETPRQWVFRDAALLPDARVGEAGIAFPGGALTFTNVAVIRNGPLISTALRDKTAWRLLVPWRMRGACETKWLARAILTDGETRHDGWVIHEVVRWA
jgi:hypothetical protein